MLLGMAVTKNASNTPTVLLWGGTAQARLIQQMLLEQGIGIPQLIFDPALAEPGFAAQCAFANEPQELMQRLPGLTHFVVCVGGARGYARAVISSFLEGLGLRPIDVRHPKAIVESTAEVGRGSQVMPGVVVHKFTEIGAFSIINTAATIDHECRLGHGVHIMGAAALAGTVRVHDFASIGTNATILPGVTIGRGAYVGAGSVVLRDVEPMRVVAGVPARVIGETALELHVQPLVALDPNFNVDRVMGWTQQGGLKI